MQQATTARVLVRSDDRPEDPAPHYAFRLHGAGANAAAYLPQCPVTAGRRYYLSVGSVVEQVAAAGVTRHRVEVDWYGPGNAYVSHSDGPWVDTLPDVGFCHISGEFVAPAGAVRGNVLVRIQAIREDNSWAIRGTRYVDMTAHPDFVPPAPGSAHPTLPGPTTPTEPGRGSELVDGVSGPLGPNPDLATGTDGWAAPAGIPSFRRPSDHAHASHELRVSWPDWTEPFLVTLPDVVIDPADHGGQVVALGASVDSTIGASGSYDGPSANIVLELLDLDGNPLSGYPEYGPMGYSGGPWRTSTVQLRPPRGLPQTEPFIARRRVSVAPRHNQSGNWNAPTRLAGDGAITQAQLWVVEANDGSPVLGGTPLPAGQLNPNPAFADGLTGWTVAPVDPMESGGGMVPAAVVVPSTSHAYADHSVRLTAPGTGSGYPAWLHMPTVTVTQPTGYPTLAVSIDYRDTTPERLVVELVDTVTEQVVHRIERGPSYEAPDDAGWRTITADVPAPAAPFQVRASVKLPTGQTPAELTQGIIVVTSSTS